MQNSRYQLERYWSIGLVVILIPLLLYATIPILPTHDDWAGTTKPDFNPFFIKEHFFFYGYHWRPFDTWIGYIVGRNPQLLYPAFNHICVVIGHVLNALLIYRVLSTLGFRQEACNIATLFFFIAPATMATVLAVDSQNQTYALLWGMLSFMAYIKLKKGKYWIWPCLIFIATLSKENGLMWALICPILAYGFDFIDKQKLKRDLFIGIGIMVAYALAIIILPKDITIHPEYVPDDYKVIKNIVKFLLTSFITIDYIYLLHQPHRNLLLAALSLALAAPFMYYAFAKNIKRLASKKMVATLISLLIAVGPHLLTVFSMMHTYAGLALIAIIIAHAIDKCNRLEFHRVLMAFMLFLVSAFVIDYHLYRESLKSGLIGKTMAQEAIRKTGSPVHSAYIIIIEDDYPKLSSFCVIPNEAFGWGLASQYETNYQWPKEIKDTTIVRSADSNEKARKLGREILDNKSYDCVWIINQQDIDVIKR